MFLCSEFLFYLLQIIKLLPTVDVKEKIGTNHFLNGHSANPPVFVPTPLSFSSCIWCPHFLSFLGVLQCKLDWVMDFSSGLYLSQVNHLSCICFLIYRFLLVLPDILPSPSSSSSSFSFSFFPLLLFFPFFSFFSF